MLFYVRLGRNGKDATVLYTVPGFSQYQELMLLDEIEKATENSK